MISGSLQVVGEAERRLAALRAATRRLMMRAMKMMALMLSVVCIMAVPVLAGGKCGCKKIHKTGNGWCEPCGGGEAFGVAIKSEKLHKALQGKKIKDKSKIKCGGCKKAEAAAGDCGGCHVAFNDGKVYHSPVAHVLSKGMKVSPKAVKCGGCKESLESGKPKFCSACDGGFVGGLAYKTKALYMQAKQAMKTLKRAAKVSKKCEGCAVALVSDGKCEHCSAKGSGGKPEKKGA